MLRGIYTIIPWSTVTILCHLYNISSACYTPSPLWTVDAPEFPSRGRGNCHHERDTVSVLHGNKDG